MPELTCEIISATQRGYKVKQTETFTRKGKKPKVKTAFYDNQDFHGERAFWIKQAV